MWPGAEERETPASGLCVVWVWEVDTTVALTVQLYVYVYVYHVRQVL